MAKGKGVDGGGVDVNEAGGGSEVDGGRGLLSLTSGGDGGVVPMKSVTSVAVQTAPPLPRETAMFSLCKVGSTSSDSSSGVSSDDTEEKREVVEEDPPRLLA